MKVGTLKTIKAFKDWFIIKAKKEGSEISVEETHRTPSKKGTHCSPRYPGKGRDSIRVY